jgi:hypothetical protein
MGRRTIAWISCAVIAAAFTLLTCANVRADIITFHNNDYGTPPDSTDTPGWGPVEIASTYYGGPYWVANPDILTQTQSLTLSEGGYAQLLQPVWYLPPVQGVPDVTSEIYPTDTVKYTNLSCTNVGDLIAGFNGWSDIKGGQADLVMDITVTAGQGNTDEYVSNVETTATASQGVGRILVSQGTGLPGVSLDQVQVDISMTLEPISGDPYAYVSWTNNPIAIPTAGSGGVPAIPNDLPQGAFVEEQPATTPEFPTAIPMASGLLAVAARFRRRRPGRFTGK